jgi:hypothetical protein
MKRYVFRWVAWNLEHATKHGVSMAECERVVGAGGIDKKKKESIGRLAEATVSDGCKWCSP